MGTILLFLSGCPDQEAPPKVAPPILEAVSPFDLKESPKGISVRNQLVLKNVGDSKMRITDFKLDPDDGVFLVGIGELPLNIGRNEQKEITITFRPTREQAYATELSLDYNHGEGLTPEPLRLIGQGISNLVCLSCDPPPAPECRLEGDTSVYFEATSSTDCENEDGICSYLVFEEVCEYGLCDEETKQCPLPEDWDAGVSWVDAGPTVDDAGISILDSGTDFNPPVICLENEYVFNNACEPCPAGSTNAAGDDASAGNTSCDATLCSANEYVNNNACEPCPAGTTNLAGDDASIGNTSCDAILCEENEYVLDNVCEPCPTGEMNAAGDDASDVNTSCSGPDLDGDGLFGSDDAYPNHHNGDLQFLIDLVTQSSLTVTPLDLGIQVWENYRLVEFNANNSDLTGSLPSSLANITEIRKLQFLQNNLSGTIPSTIGTLTHLMVLNFGENLISSPLPNELFTLGQLETLDLGENPNLTGSIPSEIANLTSLRHLWFPQSNFSGPLPPEIGSMTTLTVIMLDENQLTGNIPSEFGNLSNLTIMKLNDNQLSGAIPEQIGSLEQLDTLELSGNLLSGSIPEELGDLSNLSILNLSNNQLSGPIPEALCNLNATIDLNINQLCPNYPSCLDATALGAQETSACQCDPGYHISGGACTPTLCDLDEYVFGNMCTPCPSGTTNAAGDDASGTDTACDAEDVCDGVVCPDNATCTTQTGIPVNTSPGFEGYTCECDAGYQDNDDNGTCLPDCTQAECLNAIGCDDSSGTAECLSDEVSCNDLSATTNGVYYIDPDGLGQGEPAFLNYCEMETDGGGWTAFFAGYNGNANVFASFEDDVVQCTSESSGCLRRIPSSITTARWFAASCGEKMIKFQINAETLALFNSGQQSYWELLSNVSAIKGTVAEMPDRIWTGDQGGAQGQSWVLTRSTSGGADRNETFSSSYGLASVWDYCDGVPDAASPIFLFCR